MTKEESAKRKVDKCRDTHPRAARDEGAGRPIRRADAAGGASHWRTVGGARPAPSSRLALIELGLSFDFKWGERTVLCACKNRRCDPIPSVIGIIRYSRGSSNYASVRLARRIDTRRTRPARRALACCSLQHREPMWR